MYICIYSHISVQAQPVSRVRLLATLWTVACQAPLSMVFSRQEYWNGLPFPHPGDLPDAGIESASPVSCISSRFFTTEPPRTLIDFHKIKNIAFKMKNLVDRLNN